MKWEWQKFRSKKLNFSPILLFLILLLIPLIFQFSSSQENRDAQEIIDAQSTKTDLEAEIDRLTKQEGNPTRIATLTKKVEMYRAILSALENGDDKKALQAQSEIAQEDYQEMIASGQTGEQVKEQKLLSAKLKYFSNHQLALIEPLHTQKLPLINYFVFFIQLIPYSTLWLMALLFLCKYFTDEQTDTASVWIWLAPQKPVTLFFKKMILYFAFLCVSFVFPLLVVSVIVSIFSGIGMKEYPLFFLGETGEIVMKTAFTYLIEYVIGTILLYLLLTVLCATLSLVFEKFTITFAVSLCLITLGQLFLKDQHNILNLPEIISTCSRNEFLKRILMLVLLISCSICVFFVLIRVKEKGKSFIP
ncbi:hypothetical protein R5U34_00235 [Enterococcus faecium]|uniref:hypothetical protein n=1 Tax=Enterococcus TaxID=1350 RepID=UPI0022E9887F|nr:MULTISPECIES: hypothetical protein [Enterococcus]WOV50245.1 hypothetical protein R5U34_00235 [Enterococcus faecium]